MHFIDHTSLILKAGKGGDGIVAFRREANVPLGGPAGGDGGKGGSIIFEVDTHKSTLLDLHFLKMITAQSGENGKNKKMYGADGEDKIIKVPLGTIVKDKSDGRIIADLTHPGQQAVICRGGKGGRGNFHFKSSRNPAPDFAEKGEEGQQREVDIELKLLADVGLVGFPSVGKSTILSVVSAARPEIADYPFTTLVPNLGVVRVPDGRSFVMADMPGLIEGASQGKGLGFDFLKHIERTRVLIHVLDMSPASGRDPLEDYEIINNELGTYKFRLLQRPQVIVANKMDEDGAQENLDRFREKYPDAEVFPTCALIAEGLTDVLYRVADLLEVTDAFPLEEEENIGVLYKYEPEPEPFTIKNLGNGQWLLEGDEINRLFSRIDFRDEQKVMQFAIALKRLGVDDALREKGIKEHDSVFINDFVFEFSDMEEE